MFQLEEQIEFFFSFVHQCQKEVPLISDITVGPYKPLEARIVSSAVDGTHVTPHPLRSQPSNPILVRSPVTPPTWTRTSTRADSISVRNESTDEQEDQLPVVDDDCGRSGARVIVRGVLCL